MGDEIDDVWLSESLQEPPIGGDRLGGVWKPGDSSILRMTNECMLGVQNCVLGLIAGVSFQSVSTTAAAAASAWAGIDGSKAWIFYYLTLSERDRKGNRDSVVP
ncbi:hypothetical protein ACLB2K_038324 [Fragaria x ananassa]